MDEHIIIEGKHSKRASTFLLKTGLILVGISLLLFFATSKIGFGYSFFQVIRGGFKTFFGFYGRSLTYFLTFQSLAHITILLYAGILTSLIGFIFRASSKGCSITITEKRIYGTSLWNKPVEIPLNEITAVSTGRFKSIVVYTISDKICFRAMENHFEIRKQMIDLLAKQSGEEILITGNNSKKNSTILLKIGLFIFAAGLLLFCITAGDSFEVNNYRRWRDITVPFRYYLYAFDDCVKFTDHLGVSIVLYAGVFFSLLGLILHQCLAHNFMVVTSKRVYGATLFNQRVDLPISQISAVSTSLFKGIAVGSSAGRIFFQSIENNLEIHKKITSLLSTQVATTPNFPAVNQSAPISNTDELIKYKNLLDMGVITQEEFDAKKKQLLGL